MNLCVCVCVVCACVVCACVVCCRHRQGRRERKLSGAVRRVAGRRAHPPAPPRGARQPQPQGHRTHSTPSQPLLCGCSSCVSCHRVCCVSCGCVCGSRHTQRKGLAPIHVAAYRDHALCLGQLLEAGATLDSRASGGMVRRPLKTIWCVRVSCRVVRVIWCVSCVCYF